MSLFVLDRFLMEGPTVLLEEPARVRSHQETVRHA
jgi:hypothetical protein